MEEIYKCENCEYSTKRKYNLKRHKLKHAKRVCDCGKKYKTRHGFYKHKKTCDFQNKLKKYEAKNVKIINNNIQNIQNNNITNLSINLFLDKYCGDAKDLKDFVRDLQFTLEDIINTKNNGYVNGITKVVLKGLENIPAIERPIHCSNKKTGKLYIKDDGKWETDNVKKRGKTHKILSTLRTKQWLSIDKWEKEHPGWENNEKLIMKRLQMANSVYGGEDVEERKKEKKQIKKNISEKIEINDNELIT